jgi:hypothetical protein
MHKTGDGFVMFQDWRPIRDAIEAAYEEMGLAIPANIPKEHWNLGGLAIHFFQEQNRSSCFTCKKLVYRGDDIRCLDCKMVFCPACAEQHFWPNGRPKEQPRR